MRPLTIALQAKDCDLHKAHRMAQRLIKTLEGDRNDEKFSSLWEKIAKLAGTVDVQPAKKRTVASQRNRANVPVVSIEAYYRVSYYSLENEIP